MSCCHFGSEGYDCDCHTEEQAKKISELEKEIEKAYQILERFGVPRGRARSIPNGIQVLVSRMDKEIFYLKEQREATRSETDKVLGTNLCACSKCTSCEARRYETI